MDPLQQALELLDQAQALIAKLVEEIQNLKQQGGMAKKAEEELQEKVASVTVEDKEVSEPKRMSFGKVASDDSDSGITKTAKERFEADADELLEMIS